MAGFILAFLAALLTVASSNPISYEQEGHLQIIDTKNGVLEAVFFTDGTGIRISGDPSSISITSMSNDEVLMSGSALSDSSRLYRVLGSNFLQETTTDENGERRKHQYVVPESLAEQARAGSEARNEQRITSHPSEPNETEMAQERRNEQHITPHLTEQNKTEFQTARDQAFQRLFLCHETTLIVPAAIALGRAGIMGYENRGALNFYAVVMAMDKYQHRQGSGGRRREGSGDAPGSGGERRYHHSPRRGKRSSKRWCDYSLSYCDSGSCTMGTSSCDGKCADWEGCQGRCGPGCEWCWWFVCLSCCYQHGCHEHDVCCGENGYLSFDCAIPLGFSCSSYEC